MTLIPRGVSVPSAAVFPVTYFDAHSKRQNWKKCPRFHKTEVVEVVFVFVEKQLMCKMGEGNSCVQEIVSQQIFICCFSCSKEEAKGEAVSTVCPAIPQTCENMSGNYGNRYVRRRPKYSQISSEEQNCNFRQKMEYHFT